MQELRNVAAEYDGLEPEHALVAFLEDVALISDADTIAEADDDRDGRVTLITLHSAKGLEYPVVFMTAMEEGVLPHMRSFDDPAQMEEERRLCYVGMTRAKERLYLLRAFRRYSMGMSQHTPPSRFLKDIPPELIAQRSAVRDQYDAVERGPQRLREAFAARPEHPSAFAGGDSAPARRCATRASAKASSSPAPPTMTTTRITIAFKGAQGMKKLMLSFAPLELL